MGHEDIATTKLYVHPDFEEIKAWHVEASPVNDLDVDLLMTDCCVGRSGARTASGKVVPSLPRLRRQAPHPRFRLPVRALSFQAQARVGAD